MSYRIAILGLGHMGGAIALRLAALGNDVRGYDIDAGARDRLRAAGLTVAESPAGALAGRDLIITSVPNSAAVRASWLGGDGIIAGADPGSLLVEMSTIDPDAMREVGVAAVAAGHRVVDCPVSGSPAEAANGGLALIAAGAADSVEEITPLLGGLGGTIRYTGEVGTAKVVKLVNNIMSMGNVLVAAEAFAVGLAAGVAADKLYDVLSVSGGRSHHFTKRFPKALADDYAPGFTMSLGEKDLSLALDLARSVGAPAPTAAVVHQLFAIAVAEGYADDDIVALLKLYQGWSAR